MYTFITLTTPVFASRKILFNLQEVSIILPLAMGGSYIGLVGSPESSYVQVSESVEEIAALIAQAQKA